MRPRRPTGTPGARVRADRSVHRLGVNAVLVLLIIGWAVALEEGRSLPIQLHGLGMTCADLPIFAQLAPQLEGARRVAFVGTGARPLFCAQRDLAPLPLEVWRFGPLDPARQDLDGTVVLVHLEEADEVAAMSEHVRTAADARGLRAEVSRLATDLAVVRVGWSGE